MVVSFEKFASSASKADFLHYSVITKVVVWTLRGIIVKILFKLGGNEANTSSFRKCDKP